MIINQKKIQLDRTEWGCYDETPDYVIKSVNSNVSEILLSTHSPAQAQERIYDFLFETYNKYGFSDEIVTKIVNQYYNTNIDVWDYLKGRVTRIKSTTEE